jgi:tetratricopeptide (TPR) repeat protein
LRRLGRREEAYAQFRETIRLNRNDALAHYNLAAISLEQKNFPDAELHFMETISHNPRDTQALIGLARSQAAQAKTSAAIESYQRALSLRPDSVEARRELERLGSIKREPEATSPDQPAP